MTQENDTSFDENQDEQLENKTQDALSETKPEDPASTEGGLIKPKDNKHKYLYYYCTPTGMLTEKSAVKKVEGFIAEIAHIEKEVVDRFSGAQVLTRTFEVITKGKKKEKEENFLPGYFLVCADFSGEIGEKLKMKLHETGRLKVHSAVDVKELAQFQKDMGEQIESTDLRSGDEVTILDKQFETVSGTVGSIDEKTRQASVVIKVFGRDTTVTLPVDSLQK